MIPVPSRGRIAEPITMTVVRDLTLADIHRLVTEPITISAPPTLQKITATHHAMARLLASGKSAAAVAVLCNKTPQRVRDLASKDPAFKELVAYYQANYSEAELGDEMRLREKARNLAELAMDELQDRLEDDTKRSKIPAVTLVQLAGDQLDRTVLPKKTATPPTVAPQQITFNIAGQGRMEPKAIEPKTIDQSGEEVRGTVAGTNVKGD